MLSEGYKFNVNPEKPRYKTKGSMSAAKVIKKFAKKKATRYAIGTFIAGAAMERISAPHVTKAKKWLVRKDIERQNKKFAEKAAKMQKQRMDEGFLWKRIKPALQKSKAGGRLLTKHGPKVQKAADIAWGGSKLVTGHVARLAKKHPIVSAGLGVAAAVGGSAAKDVAKHYIAHKVKMRDPLYAQEVRKAAQAEKDLKQGKKPTNEANASGTAPSMDARTPNTQDSHPSPLAAKMGQGGHQKHHAHLSVLRGMSMDTVNKAGLAGKGTKNFKLTTGTKTNTRKESYMNLDNIIERAANTVYEYSTVDESWTTIKRAAKNVWKNRGVIARALGSKARVGVQKAVDYTVGKAQIYKMKRKPVSEEMADRANDIYEIAPIIAAAGGAALRAAGSYVASKVANKVVGKVKQKISRREDMDEVWGQVAKIALAHPRETVGVAKAAAKLTPMYWAAKGAKAQFKKLREIEETMAPGARSQFEINRIKDVRQFYGMQRSQHVDSAAAKMAELRKKINLRGGKQVKESAKDILQKTKRFAKRYPRTTKGAGIMAATLAASEVLKRHQGFQARKAEYHRKRFNQASARSEYLQRKKENKAELKTALREMTMDKTKQHQRDKKKRDERAVAKAFLDRRLAAKKKKVEESKLPNPEWRRKQIEKWKAEREEKAEGQKQKAKEAKDKDSKDD